MYKEGDLVKVYKARISRKSFNYGIVISKTQKELNNNNTTVYCILSNNKITFSISRYLSKV
jgi:hypothetical protein